MTEMRLQRFMAQAGIASRRKCEELILAGKVSINGKVVRELGVRVDPRHDRILFEGHRLTAEDHVWILLNKPKGVVSTANDPEGRETVLDVVGNQGVRLYPVGRLDYHTEGVILLTNDGDLAAALTHPSNQVPRVYQVKIRGMAEIDTLDELRQGVRLDTGETVSAQVSVLGTTDKHTWIEMILKEGRNRQIHRMMDAVGGTVLKLVRVVFAGLTTEGLKPGRYRSLTQSEINDLRAAVKLRGETARRSAKVPGRRARNTGGETESRPRPPARKSGAKSGTSSSRKKPGARPGASRPRTGSSSRPGPGGARTGSGSRSATSRTGPGPRPGSRTTRPAAGARSGGRDSKPGRGSRAGSRTSRPGSDDRSGSRDSRPGRGTGAGSRDSKPGAGSRDSKPGRGTRTGSRDSKPGRGTGAGSRDSKPGRGSRTGSRDSKPGRGTRAGSRDSRTGPGAKSDPRTSKPRTGAKPGSRDTRAGSRKPADGSRAGSRARKPRPESKSRANSSRPKSESSSRSSRAETGSRARSKSRGGRAGAGSKTRRPQGSGNRNRSKKRGSGGPRKGDS